MCLWKILECEQQESTILFENFILLYDIFHNTLLFFKIITGLKEKVKDRFYPYFSVSSSFWSFEGSSWGFSSVFGLWTSRLGILCSFSYVSMIFWTVAPSITSTSSSSAVIFSIAPL